jgi:hypothetical protein
MFKLTCGDSWVDELPSLNEDGSTNMGAALFIMTYIVIAVWTVLQVAYLHPHSSNTSAWLLLLLFLFFRRVKNIMCWEVDTIQSDLPDHPPCAFL